MGDSMEIPTPAPESPEATLTPRGPWAFLWKTQGGGFSRNGLLFLCSWVAFQWTLPALWAQHLRHLAGNSALPHYWGERLTAQDIQQILQSAGLQRAWTGFWMPVIGVITLGLILNYGWRLQAETVGLKARWKPWALGFLDALLLGLVPMGILTWAILEALAYLGSTGIQGLGWVSWIGQGLAPLCFGSALMLQWWICRLNRAASPEAPLGQHLFTSFLCLWTSPIQWTVLVGGGVVIRVGLQAAVMLLAWRWGGGTTPRVWGFWLLQGLAAAINAWVIAWFMRLVAKHWERYARIRQALSDLRRQFA